MNTFVVLQISVRAVSRSAKRSDLVVAEFFAHQIWDIPKIPASTSYLFSTGVFEAENFVTLEGSFIQRMC